MSIWTIQWQGHNIFASAEGSPVKDFQVFLEIFSYNLYHALTKGENLPWGIGWQNIGLMSKEPSMPERIWTNTFVSHLKRRNKIVPNQVWKIGKASTPNFFFTKYAHQISRHWNSFIFERKRSNYVQKCTVLLGLLKL